MVGQAYIVVTERRLLAAQAYICASGALLNVLAPMVKLKGDMVEEFQQTICSLLSFAMVLTTTQHSLQVLESLGMVGS